MFKKSYQKLLCAAILVVLLVASLVTAYAVTGDAVPQSDTKIYTLTVKFDSSQAISRNAAFSSIQLLRKGVPVEPVNASDPKTLQYKVEKGFGEEELKLVFTVVDNKYDIKSFKDISNDHSLIKKIGDSETLYVVEYNLNLQSDKTYTVDTVAKTYNIVLDETGLPPVYSVKLKNQPTYSYVPDGQVKTDVILGELAADGRDFSGWKCYDQNGNLLKTVSTKDEWSRYVMPGADLVYPPIGDTLYIQPVFNAKELPITRYDREFDVDAGIGSTIDVRLPGGFAVPTYYVELMRSGVEYQNDPVDGTGGNAGQTPLDEGGYKLYAGYEPFYSYATEENVGKYYTRLPQIYVAAEDNIVYRYYVPITYTLVYENTDGWNGPAEHRFNRVTEIPAPTRMGYHFAGWDVYAGEGDAKTLIAASGNYALDADTKALTLSEYGFGFTAADADKKITLVAKWTPMIFNVEFDWNIEDDDSAPQIDFNGKLYSLYTYYYGFVNGAEIVVPGKDAEPQLLLVHPIRVGYDFEGWSLIDRNGQEKTLPLGDGVTRVALHEIENWQNFVGDNDGDGFIKLRANWKAKTYNVTLTDENGYNVVIGATFDSPLTLPADLKAPVLKGHSFRGFADANGKLWIGVDDDNNPVAKDDIWTLDADTILYATWSVNKYDVNVSLDSNLADVYFNGTAYAGPYEYGTTLEIRIVVKGDKNYKLTRWNGDYLETHLRDATFSYTVDVENNLTATLLPIVDVSGIEVDYKKETLFLPDGNYKIFCNDTTISVVVKNSVYTINGETTTATNIALADDFFGNTLRIEVEGVKDNYADGECEIKLPAREKAPVFNKENENAWIHGYATSRDSIEIKMNPNLQALLEKLGYELEYSCVILANDGKTPLEWIPLVMDEEGIVKIVDLDYGTEYLVRIRVMATDTTPHGEVFSFELKTQHENYIKEQIRELENLKTGGEMVDSVLQEAIVQIGEYLEKGGSISTVQMEVEAILKALEERLALARVQDEQLEALTALYEALIASKEFDAAGEATLKAAYDAAVAGIKGILENPDYESLQSRVDALNKIGADTQKTMKNVSVRHLYSEDQVHQLTVGGVGLPQGSKWNLTYSENYEEWKAAIDTAIRTGNLVMDGKPISVDELKTLVLHAYAVMNLELPDQAVVDPTLGYTVRVLLPYSLRGRSVAVQAAYYKPSGELVLLDSERDGDYLVFHSNTSGVASFVILSDEEVDLTLLIWMLAIIAFCQLLAISVLLGGRAKTRRAMKHRSIALPTVVPMALAVRFLPNNAMLIVLILGATVVLLQIALMWLLLTSDLINRRKKRVRRYVPQQSTRQSAQPITTVELPEENPFDAAQMNDALTESDDAEQPLEADGFEAPEFYEGEENDGEVELLYEDGEAVAGGDEALYEDEEGVENAFDVFDEAETDELTEAFDEQAFEDDFVAFAEDSAEVVSDEAFDSFDGDVEAEEYAAEEYVAEEYVAEETNEEEASYATEELYPVEEEYAEEAYATEEEYATEEAPVASWEYDEPADEAFSEETDPDEADAEALLQEGTIWEADEIAPDPEEEMIYDDYVTGDPTEPFEEEGEICGDPNPYEVEKSTEEEADVRYTDDAEA